MAEWPLAATFSMVACFSFAGDMPIFHNPKCGILQCYSAAKKDWPEYPVLLHPYHLEGDFQGELDISPLFLERGKTLNLIDCSPTSLLSVLWLSLL